MDCLMCICVNMETQGYICNAYIKIIKFKNVLNFRMGRIQIFCPQYYQLTCIYNPDFKCIVYKTLHHGNSRVYICNAYIKIIKFKNVLNFRMGRIQIFCLQYYQLTCIYNPDFKYIVNSAQCIVIGGEGEPFKWRGGGNCFLSWLIAHQGS